MIQLAFVTFVVITAFDLIARLFCQALKRWPDSRFLLKLDELSVKYRKYKNLATNAVTTVVMDFISEG